MIFTEFALQLSRNLGPQLPALVGKALGRSGQLPSFNVFNPGTLTPPKWQFRQAGSEGKRKERRGKGEEEEKKEKEKDNALFQCVGVLKYLKSKK